MILILLNLKIKLQLKREIALKSILYNFNTIKRQIFTIAYVFIIRLISTLANLNSAENQSYTIVHVHSELWIYRLCWPSIVHIWFSILHLVK